MEETTMNPPSELELASRRIASRLVAVGENRLELFMVEMQEERRHFLRALLLFVTAGLFGLLAGVALTLAVGLLMWDYAPVAVMLVLALVYAGLAVFFYRRLATLQSQWKIMPATLDQLRKDCECLKEILH